MSHINKMLFDLKLNECKKKFSEMGKISIQHSKIHSNGVVILQCTVEDIYYSFYNNVSM